METYRGITTLAATELKLFLREPVAVFFQLIFPALLLTLFGVLFGGQPVSPMGAGGPRMIDFYLPALVVIAISQAGFIGLPVSLANYRELGVLKRFHASPVPLQAYLFAQTGVQLVMLLIGAGLMVVSAELLFGIQFGGNVLAVLLAFVVSVVSLFAFGFAMSGLLTTPSTNQAVGNFLFLMMFFLSGAAIPHQLFPDWLVTVSYALPLTHAVQALSGLWLGEPLHEHLVSLLVLVGVAVVSIAVAKRTFRWRP